jgi:branched-chain amino acid transport system permease protein
MPSWLAAWMEPLGPRDYNLIYLVIVALALMILYMLLERAVRSPWGRVLRGARDEEEATSMSGKNVPAVRVESFIVGGIVMGLAGGFYAHYVVTIDYSHFRPLFATFLVWVMLMLGGSGNNRGAVLGAFVIWAVWSGTSFLVGALEPALAAISPTLPDRAAYLRWMFVALLLAGIVLFRPQGILREETIVSRHLLGRKSAQAERGRVHERSQQSADQG